LIAKPKPGFLSYVARGAEAGLVYAGTVEKGFGAGDLRELEVRLLTGMQYVETLARGIVADVAKSTANRPMVWVPLVDIAQRMKVPLSSVETGAKAAVDWGWLKAGASLSEGVCLTEAGRALVRRVGL
jgi:hypothetical protein